MDLIKSFLYNAIHNAIRSRSFDASIKAGMIESTDPSSLKVLHENIKSLKEMLKNHASHEEKFIHPLLDERVLGVTDKLNAEHRKFDSMFGKIETYLAWIIDLPDNFEKRKEAYLEFRHNLNRFIFGYMAHIDKEESDVALLIWEVSTIEEIDKVLSNIIGNQTPNETMDILTWMLPAINLEERAFILNHAKQVVPPEAFKALCQLAQRVLSAEAWLALKPRIGVE